MAFYSILYEKGKRDKNEDTVAIHKFTTLDGEVIMALVCDGCGGMDMGGMRQRIYDRMYRRLVLFRVAGSCKKRYRTAGNSP